MYGIVWANLRRHGLVGAAVLSISLVTYYLVLPHMRLQKEHMRSTQRIVTLMQEKRELRKQLTSMQTKHKATMFAHRWLNIGYINTKETIKDENISSSTGLNVGSLF